MDQCTLHNCRDSFQDHNLSLTVVFLFHSFMGRTVCLDGVRYYPKGIFPMATSKVFTNCNWGRALRLEQTWEVATWEIAHLGCCHLGKYPWKVATWENAFGKVPNIV